MSEGDELYSSCYRHAEVIFLTDYTKRLKSAIVFGGVNIENAQHRDYQCYHIQLSIINLCGDSDRPLGMEALRNQSLSAKFEFGSPSFYHQKEHLQLMS